MKRKTLATMGLALSLGVTSLGYSEPTLAEVQTGATEDIGKNAHVYNAFSTINHSVNKMKTSLKVSFIEDPHANKQIAIVSTDGSYISAAKSIENRPAKRFTWVPGDIAAGYMSAMLQWPSSYHTEMELSGGSASFYKVTPTNIIDKKSVTSTVGYTLGGTIQTSPNGSAGAPGVNWSKSVSYDQADYKTMLTEDSSKKVRWKVPFISAMNQGWGPYDRNSDDWPYQNQLFMKSRNAAVWANDNFISNDQMPALASYGFSPGVLAVIIAEKSEKTSDLNVTFERVSDNYILDWNGATGFHGHGYGQWIGTNMKDQKTVSSKNNYILDWEKHTLIEK